MGRHKSRRDSKEKMTENKKRHSSSSSHADEETWKDKRFEKLERMIENLDRWFMGMIHVFIEKMN